MTCQFNYVVVEAFWWLFNGKQWYFKGPTLLTSTLKKYMRMILKRRNYEKFDSIDVLSLLESQQSKERKNFERGKPRKKVLLASFFYVYHPLSHSPKSNI